MATPDQTLQISAPSDENKILMREEMDKFMTSFSKEDRDIHMKAMTAILKAYREQYPDGTADDFDWNDYTSDGTAIRVTLAQYITTHYYFHDNNIDGIKLLLKFGAGTKGEITTTSEAVRKLLPKNIKSQSQKDNLVIQETPVVKKAVIADDNQRKVFNLIKDYAKEVLENGNPKFALEEIEKHLKLAKEIQLTADDFRNVDGDRNETALLAAARLYTRDQNTARLMNMFVDYGANLDVVNNTLGLHVAVYFWAQTHPNNYQNTVATSSSSTSSSSTSSSSTSSSSTSSSSTSSSSTSSSSTSSSSTSVTNSNTVQTPKQKSGPLRWPKADNGLYALTAILFVGAVITSYFAITMLNIGAAIGLTITTFVVAGISGYFLGLAIIADKRELENSNLELTHSQQITPQHQQNYNNDQINNYGQSSNLSNLDNKMATSMYRLINTISAVNNTASNNSNNNNNNNNFTFGS